MMISSKTNLQDELSWCIEKRVVKKAKKPKGSKSPRKVKKVVFPTDKIQTQAIMSTTKQRNYRMPSVPRIHRATPPFAELPLILA